MTPEIQKYSSLNIKTGSTATTTGSSRIADNLELATDQLGGEIDGASLEEFQRGQIHDHLCLALGFDLGLTSHFACCALPVSVSLSRIHRKDGIFLLIDLGRILQRHQVLETMTPAGRDGDS